MADSTRSNGLGGGETHVRSFFDAMRQLKLAETELAMPSGKGDAMLAARIKELRGYIDVFLKAELPRRPRFQIVERKADPTAPLIVECEFLDAVQFFEALSLSLSKGGLFIKTDMLLEIDTQADVTVKLKTEDISFKVSTKVIWINPRETQGRPQGIGLKLHKLNTLRREVLADFMAGNLPPEALAHLSE